MVPTILFASWAKAPEGLSQARGDLAASPWPSSYSGFSSQALLPAACCDVHLLLSEQKDPSDLQTKDCSWQGCPSPRLDIALAPSNSCRPGC